MPPTARPFPRHIAEPPRELEPYGRWGEQLAERFLATCASVEGSEELAQPDARSIYWHPERTYAGRTYVPATALNADGVELFGYVSYLPAGEGGPSDFRSFADYTDETADRNPDWKIDLNDEVIGRWRGSGDTTAEVTLIWGRPLVRGAAAATAELDDKTLDQCALVQSERFTLVAIDALSGFGDPLYLEVKLWNKRGELLAGESLYEAE